MALPLLLKLHVSRRNCVRGLDYLKLHATLKVGIE
jgi:hypothetical protein